MNQKRLRWSERIRQLLTRYHSTEYTIITNVGELENFHEVWVYEHQDNWMKVLEEVIDSLHKNKMYDLVDLS